MKLLPASFLLLAAVAQGAVVTDSFGYSINAISFEPVLEWVHYDDTPDWANLPGLTHYWEFLIARAFADDGFFYNYTFRAVQTQIGLQPPVWNNWFALSQLNAGDSSGGGTPEAGTWILVTAGISLIGIGRIRAPARLSSDLTSVLPALAIAAALAAFCVLWAAGSI